MGKKPSEATAAVNSTGLSRAVVPSITLLETSFSISALFRLNSLSKTIPFNTATPNKAINPMPADILNGISRAQSKRIPPIADKGIAE